MSGKKQKAPWFRVTKQEIEEAKRVMAEEDDWKQSIEPERHALETRLGDSWTGFLVVCLVALALAIGGYLIFAYLYDITAMGM